MDHSNSVQLLPDKNCVHLYGLNLYLDSVYAFCGSWQCQWQRNTHSQQYSSPCTTVPVTEVRLSLYCIRCGIRVQFIRTPTEYLNAVRSAYSCKVQVVWILDSMQFLVHCRPKLSYGVWSVEYNVCVSLKRCAWAQTPLYKFYMPVQYSSTWYQVVAFKV